MLFMSMTNITESETFDITQRIENNLTVFCPTQNITIDKVVDADTGQIVSEESITLVNSIFTIPILKKDYKYQIFVQVSNQVKTTQLTTPII